MKLWQKTRFEQLFSAEHTLRRVFLYLGQKETRDRAAEELVMARYGQIRAEQMQLKREVDGK